VPAACRRPAPPARLRLDPARPAPAAQRSCAISASSSGTSAETLACDVCRSAIGADHLWLAATPGRGTSGVRLEGPEAQRAQRDHPSSGRNPRSRFATGVLGKQSFCCENIAPGLQDLANHFLGELPFECRDAGRRVKLRRRSTATALAAATYRTRRRESLQEGYDDRSGPNRITGHGRRSIYTRCRGSHATVAGVRRRALGRAVDRQRSGLNGYCPEWAIYAERWVCNPLRRSRRQLACGSDAQFQRERVDRNRSSAPKLVSVQPRQLRRQWRVASAGGTIMEGRDTAYQGCPRTQPQPSDYCLGVSRQSLVLRESPRSLCN